MTDSARADLSEALAELGNAPTLRFLRDKVERLSVSADTKAILMDLAAITVNVGGQILSFGRKILGFVFDLFDRFQNIGIGIIVALVLTAVIASIPLLGPVITAMLSPLMLAFGIGWGAVQDFKNISVRNEVERMQQRMAVLAPHVTA